MQYKKGDMWFDESTIDDKNMVDMYIYLGNKWSDPIRVPFTPFFASRS